MSVTVRTKKNADGSLSQYLDIYYQGNRTKEYLKECKLIKSSNPIDKEANKSKKELAKRIALRRAEELESNGYNLQLKQKGVIRVFDFFNSFIETYDKKDIRNVIGVYNTFKAFIESKRIKNLTFNSLDENLIHQFTEYLKKRCTGEGASSYYARFKKVIRQAVREKIISDNPCTDITIKKDYSLKKEVLTLEELNKLYLTKASNEIVKNAFLFCCYTGLRWADVITLEWTDIDLENQIVKKRQTKTNKVVEIPFNENLLLFIPTIKKGNLVFDLPTHNGAKKTLVKWMSDAKIKKKITWHCARHSYCTNLLILDVPITTISALAGHSSLVETQRYVKVMEDMKRNAIGLFPRINSTEKV